ncbi:MAG: transporter substrate-binding domain-containing protein [Alphaproteobacteria bacterium]|nr:transporter substrate-binding domain-containing protein [Alphaproteobacteria bacterium]
MKKTLLTVFTFSILTVLVHNALAFVRYEDKHPKKVTELHMTGYINYAPFGWVDNPDGVVYGQFHTVFQPMIDTFIKEANIKMHYDLQQKTFDDLAQKVRQGDIDFMVGAYYQTEMFKGLHLLYPAAMHNPITVFMLPNRINEVKTTDDLKKLKGVRYTGEYFSDFVEKKVAELNPMEVDTIYQMFEKLFTKEADYIISSYYFGMLEAIRLGLKKQIAPAKEALWNIPVFVGVSKTSRNRELISKRLTKYLNETQNTDMLKRNIQNVINDFEKKYEGVVPPTFSLDKDDVVKKDENINSLSEKPNNKLDGE